MERAEALALPVGRAMDLPAARIKPNPWNPNRMDEAMLDKERASIEQFGFVVPLIVREVGPIEYEIVDGEHRWMIGQEYAMTVFPCWNLGIIDDDVARQLTVVLNETHGSPDEGKLSALVQDLLKRRDENQLRKVMPFDRQRFDALAKRGQVDWEVLERKRKELQQGVTERWVERVFRMPHAAVVVLDQALEKAMAQGETDLPWRALELMAADYLASD